MKKILTLLLLVSHLIVTPVNTQATNFAQIAVTPPAGNNTLNVTIGIDFYYSNSGGIRPACPAGSRWRQCRVGANRDKWGCNNLLDCNHPEPWTCPVGRFRHPDSNRGIVENSVFSLTDNPCTTRAQGTCNTAQDWTYMEDLSGYIDKCRKPMP